MRTIAIIASAFAAAALHAGNSYFITFPVQAPAGVNGEGAQAASAAGVTILRHQIPGEAAVQLAGPDGPGIGRIYTQPGKGSFVLLDAGSQWETSVSQLQTILGIVETYSGQFAWQGKAYSGAVSAVVNKADIVAGRLSLGPLLLTEVPAPQLLSADTDHIHVSIPGVLDEGGQASGLQLWRKGSDGTWLALAELGLSATAQSYQDTSVVPNSAYWYGISVIYHWPGGGQAGALPNLGQKYVSWARSESSLLAASKVQPSPTPFPTLEAAVPTPDMGGASWLAYPNPSRDGKFRLSFHTTKQGSYKLAVYTIDGSLAKTFSASFDQAGWQQPWLDMSKLSTGIYLFQLRVSQEGDPENTLPLRKVAIIR